MSFADCLDAYPTGTGPYWADIAFNNVIANGLLSSDNISARDQIFATTVNAVNVVATEGVYCDYIVVDGVTGGITGNVGPTGPTGATYYSTSQQLGGATGSVIFSGFPSNGTNMTISGLILSTNATLDSLYVQFNGDTGANYSYANFYGDITRTVNVSGTTATNEMRLAFCGPTGSNNPFNTYNIVIPNYANTITSKAATCSNYAPQIASSPYIFTLTGGGTWSSTTAITSIKLFLASGANFVIGSTFNLQIF